MTPEQAAQVVADLAAVKAGLADLCTAVSIVVVLVFAGLVVRVWKR